MNKPKELSKILVCIDGSEESKTASYHATTLAMKYNSQLIAITVSNSPYLDSLSQNSEPKKMVEEEDKNKERQEVAEWFETVSKTAKEHKVELRTRVVTTHLSASTAIVHYAEQEGVDLIVVGTRGRTGLKRILLGSTASSIVTYAHCPVMVVR